MWPARNSMGEQLLRVAMRNRAPFRLGRQSLRSSWLRVGRFAQNEQQLVVDTSQRDERMRRLESILFLSREPLTSRKLSQYANLADATEARTLVRQLNEIYDGSGRAFRVEEVAGGYQLLTRPKFASWLRRLEHVPAETRLSAPALETLSVVAYRQPAPRAEIEAIRGVSCGEILRQLMERDLVRIAGRSDELGRPYLYGTTKQFLRVFGLKSLDKLPRVEQFRDSQQSDALMQVTDCQQISDPEKEESDVPATTTERLSEESFTEKEANVVVSDPACIDDGEFEDEFGDDDDDDDDGDDDDDDDEFDDEDDYDEDEYDDEFDEDEDEDEDDGWEEVEDDEEEDSEDDWEDDWDDDDDDDDDDWD